MGQGTTIQAAAAATSHPAPLAPLRRPTPATAATQPALAADQLKAPALAPAASQAVPAATVSLTPASADVHLDANNMVVDAAGKPYGGVISYVDPATGAVLDDKRQPVDTRQFGSEPRRATRTQTDAATIAGLAQNVQLTEKNQLVNSDGSPFLGRELYYDAPTDRVLDAKGLQVDPATLPGWVATRELSPGDAKTVHRIRVAADVGAGAFWAGLDGLRYRRSLTGMQGRVTRLQSANAAFAKGHSVSGKLAGTPVLGTVARALDTRRTSKITKLNRAVTLAQATPLQEARLRAQEKLSSLKETSQAFRRGEGLGGRLQETPVVGTAAKAIEGRRQATIRQLSADLRHGDVTPSVGTRVRNAVRGRVLPTIMLGVDAFGIYTNVKGLKDAGNTRKWDDYLRIGGNSVSAVGDLMAFKRGDLTHAIGTHVAGIVISTVGQIANDQD